MHQNYTSDFEFDTVRGYRVLVRKNNNTHFPILCISCFYHLIIREEMWRRCRNVGVM